MPITDVHPSYGRSLKRWRRNRAAVSGQDAIHDGGTLYLPDDNNGGAPNRYIRLLQRATWTPFTGYTLEGLTGAVFRKPSLVELPSAMEYMLEDANGAGLSLEQVAKSAVGEVLAVGRTGFMADYPQAEQGMSAEQVAALMLRPRIVQYLAESIDGWRYQFIAGTLRLQMVKLVETEEIDIDEFSVDVKDRYRVLRLNADGIYEQALYTEGGVLIGEPMIPRKGDGTPWRHIPFHFAGASTNLPDVDEAPLSGIADLNIAHYQVTADKRQNLHVHSGGLLVIASDMSAEDFATQNPNGITVGADQGVFVGSGGSAEILQLDASSQSQSEIESIQNQLVAIGARLITAQGGNETAEAARIAASAEASALSNMVGNISEALEAALEDCALFAGANPADVKFMLNTEFFDTTLDPQEIAQLIMLGDRQILATSDVRARLRKGSLIGRDRTDEEIEAEVGTQSVPGL